MFDVPEALPLTQIEPHVISVEQQATVGLTLRCNTR